MKQQIYFDWKEGGERFLNTLCMWLYVRTRMDGSPQKNIIKTTTKFLRKNKSFNEDKDLG